MACFWSSPDRLGYQSKTTVKNLEDLMPGDHIQTPQGKTDYIQRRDMIVTQVDKENQRVRVVHFNDACQDPTKPLHQVIESWEALDVRKLNIKRMVYDPSNCYPVWEIVRRAELSVGLKQSDLSTVPSGSVPSSQSTGSKFAVDCVCGESIVNAPNSSPISHKSVRIRDLNDLKPGDHISLHWTRGELTKYRHMVVVEVDQTGSRVKAINYHSHSKGPKDPAEPNTVVEKWEAINSERDVIWRYDYDPKDIFNPDITLLIAKECLLKNRCELSMVLPLPLKRREFGPSRYFAEWAKTGRGWDYGNGVSDDFFKKYDIDLPRMSSNESKGNGCSVSSAKPDCVSIVTGNSGHDIFSTTCTKTIDDLGLNGRATPRSVELGNTNSGMAHFTSSPDVLQTCRGTSHSSNDINMSHIKTCSSEHCLENYRNHELSVAQASSCAGVSQADRIRNLGVTRLMSCPVVNASEKCECNIISKLHIKNFSAGDVSKACHGNDLGQLFAKSSPAEHNSEKHRGKALDVPPVESCLVRYVSKSENNSIKPLAKPLASVNVSDKYGGKVMGMEPTKSWPGGKRYKGRANVYQLDDLQPGYHIYVYKGKTNSSLRGHMIVTDVDPENDKVKVVHYNRKCKDPKKPLDQVIESWETLDFSKLNVKRMLYDGSHCYPSWEIVRRAELSVGMVDLELPYVPSCCNPSLHSAGDHFAVDCVSGGQMIETRKSPSRKERRVKSGLINDLAILKPGDHISLHWNRGNYSKYRHMILVEVDTQRSRVKAIHYHSHSTTKDSKVEPYTVIEKWEVIDPEGDEIRRYYPDPKDKFSPQITLLNAKGCLGKNKTELSKVLPLPLQRRKYSPSRYFAEWCQTGLGWDYVDPILSGDDFDKSSGNVLGITIVQTMDDIDVGDHIAYEDEFGSLTHGIVELIEEKKGQIQVISHNVKDKTTDLCVQSDIWLCDYKIYRCEYADCLDPEKSLERARKHLGHGVEQLGQIVPDVTTCPDLSLMSLFFVKWCKIGKGWAYHDVGKTKLTSLDQLCPGDHIEVERCLGAYLRHFIIDSVQEEDENPVTIIRRRRDTDTKEYIIERQLLPKGHKYLAFESRNVYRINYHPNDCFEADDVLERARSMIDKDGYHLFKENCEHFARWCKTNEHLNFQGVNIKPRALKVVIDWLGTNLPRLPAVVLLELIAELFDNSIATILHLKWMAIVGDTVAVTDIILKEYKDYRRYERKQENLLNENLIDERQKQNDIFRYKCKAISRVVCMVIGMLVGEFIETFIPVPVIRTMVSVTITGLGYVMGNGMGVIIFSMLEKLKDLFDNTEHREKLDQMVSLSVEGPYISEYTS